MAWERKMMRTVRVRNERKVGVLARLLTAIASVDASVGSMDLISETAQSVVRDITIYADDAEHMDHVIEVMRTNEGTRVLEVRDEVLALHQKGKIAIRSRFPIDSIATLRRVYTPGVAEVCLKIADDPELARLYTSISHMVAIVTDGSAVLGLGDIGPLASMPVMEGKAMLMETMVGLSGMPILLNTKAPDEVVNAVYAISPPFAAIQLEDISAPRCFEMEERFQAMLDIPVLHDDQHGTAVVSTAALKVAASRADVDLSKVKIGATASALKSEPRTGLPVNCISIFPIAFPAAPKPISPIFTLLKSTSARLAATFNAAVLTTAVPCWSSCNTGISSMACKRSSISKQRGAEISSSWIAAKVGEMAYTALTISSGSLVFNRICMPERPTMGSINMALPSITGMLANGPISPKPNTADPSVTMATI